MSLASTIANSDVPTSRTRVLIALRPKIVLVSLMTCEAMDWICETPPARLRAAGEYSTSTSMVRGVVGSGRAIERCQANVISGDAARSHFLRQKVGIDPLQHERARIHRPDLIGLADRIDESRNDPVPLGDDDMAGFNAVECAPPRSGNRWRRDQLARRWQSSCASRR